MNGYFQLITLVSLVFIIAVVQLCAENMQSGGSESVNRVQSLSSADARGKHRIQAELKRVEQEAKFLEEELEKLENVEGASVLCKEILSNVETKSDPLPPVTTGPLNPLWDRWFEGPQDSKGCSCWIL